MTAPRPRAMYLAARLPRVRAFAYLDLRDPPPFVKSVVFQVPFAQRVLRRGLRRLVRSRVAPTG